MLHLVIDERVLDLRAESFLRSFLCMETLLNLLQRCVWAAYDKLAGWHVGRRGRIEACYLIVRGMNGWNGFLIGSCRACVPAASSGGPQTVGRRLRLHGRPACSSQRVATSETILTNLRIAWLPPRQYLITRSMKSQSYLLMLNRRFYVIETLNTHTLCRD